jgi:hypothetical protein
VKFLNGSLIVFLVAVGCRASFTPLPSEPVPPPAAHPPTLRLETANLAQLERTPDNWVDWYATDIAGIASRAIWQSRWVVPHNGASEPDLNGTLTVRTFQRYTTPGIAIFTAMVIPSVTVTKVEVELTVGSGTAAIRSCTRSYIQRTWNQVFLLLVYPFRAPAHRKFVAAERLALSCLSDLLAEKRDAT